MDLFNAIWQGLLVGMGLSLMLGTVFFSLIQNSISYGERTGVYIALGVIACDIIFISLAILSVGFAKFLSEYEKAVSIAGGSILVVMGAYSYIKAGANKHGRDFSGKPNSATYYFINGFLLNAVNPVNFFSWLAISSMLTVKYHYEFNNKVIFFISSLCSIFLVEVLIAYFASKVKVMATPLVIKRINQFSGIVFIIFGLKLAIGSLL